MSAGSQLSRLPRKCCNITSGVASDSPPVDAVGVLNPVGGTEHLGFSVDERRDRCGSWTCLLLRIREAARRGRRASDGGERDLDRAEDRAVHAGKRQQMPSTVSDRDGRRHVDMVACARARSIIAWAAFSVIAMLCPPSG